MECDESFDDFVERKYVPRRKAVIHPKPNKKKKKKCTSESTIETNFISSFAPELATDVFSYDCKSHSIETESPYFCATVADKENVSSSDNVVMHGVSDNLTEPILPQDIVTENHEISQTVKESQESCIQHSSVDLAEDCPIQHCSQTEVEANWTCIVCGNEVSLERKESHLQNCIRTYGHTEKSVKRINDEPSSLPLTCNICNMDITRFSLEDRCDHVNKCLDSKIENVTGSSAESQTSTVFITECPLCLKNCNTTQKRLVHIKKCSKAKGISLQNVIVALQMQQKHTIERMALGLPLPQTNVPEKKTSERIPKKMSEPKSQADADIQFAKALSLSFQEEEKRKDLLAMGDKTLDEICMSNLLKPPAVQDRPGKRKKKNANKPIPILLLRTEEERQKLFEERISIILAAPRFMEGVTSDKSYIPEICPLWALCGTAKEKTSYYVQDLTDFVTPDNIDAGSKLQDISQVAGHHIYTQKPCDYTFGYSQENEDNMALSGSVKASEIPSTQEIVNIMAVMAEETSVHSKTVLSQSSVTHTQGKDGFFCESNDDIPENPMISLLETLVGRDWMSDVNIVVSDGSIIPAHSLLLQLRCPKLRQILETSKPGEKKTLEWAQIPAEVAKDFLHYVYTGSKKCLSTSVFEMRHLAMQCGIDFFDAQFECDVSTSMDASIQADADVIDDSPSQKSIPNSMSSPPHSHQIPSSDATELKKSPLLEQSRLHSTPLDEYPDDVFLENQDSTEKIVAEEKEMNVLDDYVPSTPETSFNRTLDMQQDYLGSPDLFAEDSDNEDTHAMNNSDDRYEDSKTASSPIRPISSASIDLMELDTTVELKLDEECEPAHEPLTKDLPSNEFTDETVAIKSEHWRSSCSEMHILEKSSAYTVTEEQACFDIHSEGEEQLDSLSQVPPSPSEPSLEANHTMCMSPLYSSDSNCTVKFQEEIEASQRIKCENSVDSASGLQNVDVNDECDPRCHSTPHCDKVKDNLHSDFKTILFPIGGVNAIAAEGNDEILDPVVVVQQSPANSIIVLSSDDEIDTSNLIVEENHERSDDGGNLVQDAENHVNMKAHNVYKYSSSEDERELIPLDQRLKNSAEKENTVSKKIKEDTVSKKIKEDTVSKKIKEDTVHKPPSKAFVPDPCIFSEDDDSFLIENQKPQITGSKSASCAKPCTTSETISKKDLKESPIPIPRAQITYSPVTPLPDYKTMFTPEIKIALKKFGIRALPRKKAVAILNHIYDETHPFMDGNGDIAKNVETSEKSSDILQSQKSKPVTRKRKGKTDESNVSCKPHKKKSKAKISEPILSQDNSDEKEVDLSNSQTSRSDLSDVPEEIYEMANEEPPCSQATYCSAKDHIYEIIRSDNNLYSKILMYEPLVLNEFHAELKEKGLKISAAQLMDFFDEECITFTLPRSEKYKKKQQTRCQNFRKKMIAQLSQPTG